MPLLNQYLSELYGEAIASQLCSRIGESSAAWRDRMPDAPRFNPDQSSAVLITYGDMLNAPGAPPLAVLHSFLNEYCRDILDTIHILPFFPYSSDDGFSVIDYRAVNPDLGGWDDITALAKDFSVGGDAVFNHISSQSAWFKAWQAGDPAFRHYFIEVDPHTDLSQVVRPRSLPLLTSFETADRGIRWLWTTFSDDQIDINIQYPPVLLELIDIMLMYVSRGISLVRLDAIAFLWKEIGTPCIHLRQTHLIIKIFRMILEDVAPHAGLLVEANVPHLENISYFGDNRDEAQMVYQFPLPPLTAHALLRGTAEHLSSWLSGLDDPPGNCTFLNFLASHDGIGLRPATGFLDDLEIDFLITSVTDRGGHISYKRNPDGSDSPYECNINYLSLLDDGDCEASLNRFIAAHALMLAMPGVPALYFHSLVGSLNYHEGVEQNGRYRVINREKLSLDQLKQELNSPGHLRHQIFSRLAHLLAIRRAEPAFHPKSGFRVLHTDPRVLSLQRGTNPDFPELLVLINCSASALSIILPADIPAILRTDILTGTTHSGTTLTLKPWQVFWLK